MSVTAGGVAVGLLQGDASHPWLLGWGWPSRQVPGAGPHGHSGSQEVVSRLCCPHPPSVDLP